ncbi:MAG TPA: hypothetical protein VGE74_15785 [Gemmata sp.]
MRLAKEMLQVPFWAGGLALVGGAISLVTAIVCEDVGLVRYLSHRESLQAALRSLILGATAGGLLGSVWSAGRCNFAWGSVLEPDDEVW